MWVGWERVFLGKTVCVVEVDSEGVVVGGCLLMIGVISFFFKGDLGVIVFCLF